MFPHFPKPQSISDESNNFSMMRTMTHGGNILSNHQLMCRISGQVARIQRIRSCRFYGSTFSNTSMQDTRLLALRDTVVIKLTNTINRYAFTSLNDRQSGKCPFFPSAFVQNILVKSKGDALISGCIFVVPCTRTLLRKDIFPRGRRVANQ